MSPVALVFVLIGLVNARQFQNPVLDFADYPDPGVIFENGVYYAVTTTNNNENEKYPMHTSTDLQNWTKIGYLFNQSNFPSWSKTTNEFWAPEIHKIGNDYRAYFTSRNVNNGRLSIGVARSAKLEGPYIASDTPLVSTQDDALDATLVREDDRIYLVWRERLSLWARNLTADGMRFADDTILEIMTNDIPWEGTTVEGPWQVIRNGWYYLFYSGNNFCSEDYVVGVGRSRNALGPFEKKQQPILVSNDKFQGPGHGSIIRDVDGQGYVFVYHAWHTGEVCSTYRVMMSSTVEWGNDDWPLNITITT